MSQTYASMPLSDSPWVSIHDADDLENYETYFRGLSKKVADLLESPDTRTSEPFLNGAQQGVLRFNITTRASKATSRTTMRFSEMKEGKAATTIFLVSDASRNEAQKSVVGILQYCMQQEIKRHPNKSRLVYFIADEATNARIYGLQDLLTWARAAGLRFHLIFQNLPAFRAAYGKDALATMLSETEIKQFLPGQREPETLDLIEKMLGQMPVVAEGRSGNTQTPDYRVSGTDFREDARPLMTADEIRRMDHAILFIRRNRPMQVELPPIAAIHPFRNMIDINPYHGKPFRLPIKLRLNRNWPLVRSLMRKTLGRKRKPRQLDPAVKKANFAITAKFFRLLSKLVTLWPLAIALWFFLPSASPHLRWSYEYRQHGASGPRYFTGCTYLGARGFITPDIAPGCPLVVFLDAGDWR